MQSMKELSEQTRITKHMPREYQQSMKTKFFDKDFDISVHAEKVTEMEEHQEVCTRSIVVCTPSVHQAIIGEFGKLDIPQTDSNIVAMENLKLLLGMEK